MKILAIFIASLALCLELRAQNDVYNIGPVREQAQRLLAVRSMAAPGDSFDLDQLKLLHQALVANRVMMSKMPEQMLAGIRREVEPLRTIAKDLSDSSNEHERYYGAVLNTHLLPSEETQASLLKLAHDGQGGTASTALNALFELKLDTPELRADLVAALEENPPRLGKRNTFRAMARNNIGEWGVVEAVPALIRNLEKLPTDGRPFDGPAVVQLTALGPAARDALPLLQRLLAEREAAGNSDFREIEALRFAVKAVGTPPPATAQDPAVPTPGSDDPETAETPGGVTPRPAKANPIPVGENPERSPILSWWTLGVGIASLLIALGAWFGARKKRAVP